MDSSKKIGNISGNKFGDNVNFQSDNSIQLKIEENNQLMQALEALKSEIAKISNVRTREECEVFTETLENAIEKKDTHKIKRCLLFLRDRVEDVTTILTLASLCGISLT